jgi:uncharacterized protein YjiS (DUF1127 family)
MLDRVSDFKTTTVADRWWLPVRRAFAAAERQTGRRRLPRELASLPDHLLLDIGVDPRCVPHPAGEIIARPDLTRTGLVPPVWRSTAKS